MLSNPLLVILLIIGSLLVVDCLALFALAKINFGTIVPFIIGVVFLLHAFFWQPIEQVLQDIKWLKLIWQALWFLFGCWLLSFLLFVGVLIKQIKQDSQPTAVTAVIVLGAGVNGDKPTATLASRLDRAAELIKQQPNIQVITTGGIGIGREHSEAYVMAKYLQEKHQISMKSIQQEGKSTSTEENLLYSQSLLTEVGVDYMNSPVAIVTSDFHTIRAKKIAQKQGYQKVMTLASDTPLSIRFNAWFREYFAFISGWLLNEY